MINLYSNSKKNANFLSILAIFSAILAIFTFVSCSKSGASEQEQISTFVKNSNSTYVADPSGLMYQIITPGTGTKPRAISTVSATYVGTYLNGKEFDSHSTPIDFPLNGVIQGWQIGLQFIAPGGEIKLIIPSALGYGPSGYNGIPGGTPLFFDVKLVSIKTY
jgi:FKBP-type peptidyl-prolyl cis-trans isomerase